MKFVLKNARLSFPALFEPRDFNGDGKFRWSANFIVPKNDPQIDELKKIITAISLDQWKDKSPAILKQLETTDKTPLHDGDVKTQDGYEGMYFLSASNARVAPKVVDRDRTPLQESDGRIYGGCFVNAHVDLYAQDSQWGRRINATLTGVQFVKDGDAFSGGRMLSDDEFEDLSGSDVGDLI